MYKYDKYELLEIIPKLKEIAEYSKSLSEHLMDMNMRSCFSLPIVNDNSISLYESFINNYIDESGNINYDGLNNFHINDISIKYNNKHSHDAIMLYLYDGSATYISFTIIFTIDGHIKFIVNEIYDFENNTDNIGKFIAKIILDNKFKEIEVK